MDTQAAYVFVVEDVDADAWHCEVAVVAADRRSALRKVREAGAHLKQLRDKGRHPVSVSVAEFGEAFADPSTILRRRYNDDGWSAWSTMDEGVSLNSRVSGGARVHHPHGRS